MKKGILASAYASVPGAILTALLGVVLLVWPSLSGTLICYVLAAAVLVYGVLRIYSYFHHAPQSAVKQHDFSLGIMMLAIALFIVLFPDLVISLIPSILGLLLVMGAARETQIAIDLHRLGEPRWYPPLIVALMQAILGVIILWNPFATALVLMRFIGISVVIESISQIIFSIMINRVEKANGEKTAQ